MSMALRSIPRCVCSLTAGTAFAVGVLARLAVGDQVEWKLVFEDDFERAILGSKYEADKDIATIEGGALRLAGREKPLLLAPLVSRDVRVEFDARPLPDAPPASLGCLLHSSTGDHYRLEFNPAGNGIARITGPGLALTKEQAVARTQSGRPFRFSAQREGKQFTLKVDATVVLEGAVEKIVGSSGLQRVGLISEQGMLVDNLRIYSRVPPHPDCCPPPLPWLPLTRQKAEIVLSPGQASTPALTQAVSLLNERRFEEARARFEAMDDVTLKLTGLAFLLGHLDYFEKPVYGDLISREEREQYSPRQVIEYFGEFGSFAARWREELTRHPDNEILRLYAPFVEHFGRLCLNRWNGPRHAKALADLDERINPFSHKAGLYAARFAYWQAMEGGNEPAKAECKAQMKRMLSLYPDNRILREYVGDPVPWGEQLNADTDKHPAWAAYLREAYARECAIIERIFESRQRSDGQIGGGYGDDVEALRKIVPIAAISAANRQIIEGVERLAEGVWKYDTVEGYNPDVSDVEHSSEQSADSFPTMMLLRYGDPRFYEFNLRSAKTIREKFMGIDAKGHPRFLSGTFGSKGVATHDRAGGDTGYHARAMKHFLWLAWYGNSEALDWYVRWLDGWREAAMTEAPDKPSGVLPGTLGFPSGHWQHPWSGKPWYAEDPTHLYGPWGLGVMLQESFLNVYALTGDPQFLKPMQLLMDWATLGPLQRDQERDKLQPGSREWFRMPMAHQAGANLTALYRYLTGERVYDEYTMRFGTSPQLYPIDHDLNRLISGIEKAAKSLRTNLWYWTTETLSTDRLHLPAVAEVWSAYTGAINTTGDCELPTWAVTYDTPDTNFAAMAVETTPRRLRVWLYSFWDQPTPIALRVWQLIPGRYVLNAGEQLKGEFPFQHRYAWEPSCYVDIQNRGQAVPMTLPPQKVYVFDLRLDEAKPTPQRACDLALHERDMTVQGRRLIVNVHNIGNAAAENCIVAVQQKVGDAWTTLGTQCVPRLSPPVNLSPLNERVIFDVPALDLTAAYRIVLDPENEIDEICETNNVAELPSDPVGPVASRLPEEGEPVVSLPPTLQLDLGDGLNIELVLVPAGEFMMGLPNNEPRAGAYERPPHRVRIDRPFYMGKYEVTQAQWKRVMGGHNPSHFQGDDNLPVEMVSWNMAHDFCERLSRRVRRSVRLPSEAEWEYACRAGSTSYWSFGDNVEDLCDYAWYGGRDVEGRTHPVGMKKPNAWGLYDMHGNVREWCADWFEPYPQTKAPPTDFASPRRRILRGGSWDWVEPENQGSARRDHAVPDARRDHYGLRIVVPVDEAPFAARPDGPITREQ
ncbi:MAG: SUMF1/EgtB/PvdO family nonheme iron enzyme [Phycisphaerae bacterium]